MSFVQPRVSIRKTFAQFLRNETQHFSFIAHHFCAKKQQFAQSFAKVISRKIALFRFCATQVFRNFVKRLGGLNLRIDWEWGGSKEGLGLKCMFSDQFFQTH